MQPLANMLNHDNYPLLSTGLLDSITLFLSLLYYTLMKEQLYVPFVSHLVYTVE